MRPEIFKSIKGKMYYYRLAMWERLKGKTLSHCREFGHDKKYSKKEFEDIIVKAAVQVVKRARNQGRSYGILSNFVCIFEDVCSILVKDFCFSELFYQAAVDCAAHIPIFGADVDDFWVNSELVFKIRRELLRCGFSEKDSDDFKVLNART